LNEDAGTLEEVVEPYLIQQGFIQRTPRGRQVTNHAWRHFGLVKPARDGDLFNE
ncbi:MAG TPA: Holliday junction branch migration DNA helicase RuvB, partial [Alcanivorax sp.]|nr:Holliday junction branch migration DNA helicase RuvB [Alcanivorax sp.]